MKMYDVQMVEHESKLLAQFKHRNIVRRYDSFVVEIDHRQYYLLVLEYCEEGTLESYLLYFQYRLTREQGY
jgi:serine/threonine protein kinase